MTNNTQNLSTNNNSKRLQKDLIDQIEHPQLLIDDSCRSDQSCGMEYSQGFEKNKIWEYQTKIIPKKTLLKIAQSFNQQYEGIYKTSEIIDDNQSIESYIVSDNLCVDANNLKHINQLLEDLYKSTDEIYQANIEDKKQIHFFKQKAIYLAKIIFCIYRINNLIKNEKDPDAIQKYKEEKQELENRFFQNICISIDGNEVIEEEFASVENHNKNIQTKLKIVETQKQILETIENNNMLNNLCKKIADNDNPASSPYMKLLSAIFSLIIGLFICLQNLFNHKHIKNRAQVLFYSVQLVLSNIIP